MSVIVRFAPSPTGYLHIGGARSALFNYLFAKKNAGKFLLRIEDTDKKRSTKEAIDAILDGLNWLGLNPDEKEIYQSQNINSHREVANKLLEEGKAYYCYTSQEELADLRQKAQEKNQVFRFKSPWRDKVNSQNSDVKPVIRIKAPLQGETIIEDLIQGKVVVKNEELDDFVILRNDETPTYMLAAVVDDHNMNISHIIRGDDHLNNTFRQKVIFDALNWDCPKFAHMSLIHGSDGAKMSKRHGATSVIEYKNMGYLSEAMRNYLLRLGFSHGDLEIIDDAQAKEIFDLKNVGKSPARFDFAKLDNLNKHYIKEKDENELLNLTAEFFGKSPSNIEKERVKRALGFVKERCSNLKDLAQSLEIYFDNYSSEVDEKGQNILAQKQDLLLELKEILEKIESWEIDEIKSKINLWAESKSFKMKDFGPLLRVALTFSSKSAGGIFDILEILGKEESLKRIVVR